MRTRQAVASARNWLNSTGATHITLEGPRVGRKRYTVDYAIQKVRTMLPTHASVNSAQGVCTLTGWDPITGTHQTIGILHQPQIRRQIGVMPDGKPEYRYEDI